jgi:hypothetical protein
MAYSYTLAFIHAPHGVWQPLQGPLEMQPGQQQAPVSTALSHHTDLQHISSSDDDMASLEPYPTAERGYLHATVTAYHQQCMFSI